MKTTIAMITMDRRARKLRQSAKLTLVAVMIALSGCASCDDDVGLTDTQEGDSRSIPDSDSGIGGDSAELPAQFTTDCTSSSCHCYALPPGDCENDSRCYLETGPGLSDDGCFSDEEFVGCLPRDTSCGNNVRYGMSEDGKCWRYSCDVPGLDFDSKSQMVCGELAARCGN